MLNKPPFKWKADPTEDEKLKVRNISLKRPIFKFECKKCGCVIDKLTATQVPADCPHCSANKIPHTTIRSI